MTVYKITRPEYAPAGYTEKSLPALLNSIEAEMEGAEPGDVLTITVGEMTEEQYAALPEFTGW